MKVLSSQNAKVNVAGWLSEEIYSTKKYIFIKTDSYILSVVPISVYFYYGALLLVSFRGFVPAAIIWFNSESIDGENCYSDQRNHTTIDYPVCTAYGSHSVIGAEHHKTVVLQLLWV